MGPARGAAVGAAALLALAALNPDAYIARHNLDRFAETGKVDTAYLAGLSADAVPALRAGGLRDAGADRRRRLAGVEPRPGAGDVGGLGADVSRRATAALSHPEGAPV